MLGYFLPENPGVLVPPENGWYDTGDIVEITDDGFVKILGRAKRFAKIGGEMVSLTAVEELAASTWPESASAAISVAHPQRGEEIILFTEKPSPSRKDLLEKARANGISELCVPKSLVEAKIPTLGTGKPDYLTLASQHVATLQTEVGD
jgi:acyl-[acyl-carrier-protein]-phospholipid O-acyltransferase/long-chain-fatty-acid--[acyl-carrier-protein] ligase